MTARRAALLLVVLPLVALFWWIGDTFVVRSNLRMTSADLYRSGQLQSSRWASALEEAKYRSVLNLRGAKPASGWYQDELRFAADHGIAHYDYALLANQAPTVEQMKEIVQIMRDAPKPLLIHCKNGSDRSGLAAALYRYAVDGVPAATAGRQLSLWYGHFPWLLSQSGAMDAAFATYVASGATQARTDGAAGTVAVATSP